MSYSKPLPVSPLIRGARWGLFLAGFIYARFKQRVYNALEAHHREDEARKKIIRDKEMAVVKAKLAAEERESVRQFETGQMFATPGSSPPPPPKGGGDKSGGGGGGIGKLPDGSPCRER